MPSNGANAVVFRLEGVLDLAAAEGLVASLAGAGRTNAVRIDLTRIRDFDDSGVMLLARALAARGAPSAVRGLRRHHVRLLQYLGIDAGKMDLGSALEAN